MQDIERIKGAKLVSLWMVVIWHCRRCVKVMVIIWHCRRCAKVSTYSLEILAKHFCHKFEQNSLQHLPVSVLLNYSTAFLVSFTIG